MVDSDRDALEAGTRWDPILSRSSARVSSCTRRLAVWDELELRSLLEVGRSGKSVRRGTVVAYESLTCTS